MHIHLENAINLFAIPVRILNQPIVKENIKNVAGVLTCACGLLEMYDLYQDMYQVLRGRPISTESGFIAAPQTPSQTAPKTSPGWMRTLHKIVIVCAKISLILSAGVSRPGIFIISSLAGCIFSTSQFDRIGPNTTFAVNPWHPRHLASIVAVILALPALAQSTYRGLNWGVNWTYKKIWHHQNAPKGQEGPKGPKGLKGQEGQEGPKGQEGASNTQQTQQSVKHNRYLTDAKVRLINLFNTITSRPILHLGNQLCRSLIRCMRTSPVQ